MRARTAFAEIKAMFINALIMPKPRKPNPVGRVIWSCLNVGRREAAGFGHGNAFRSFYSSGLNIALAALFIAFVPPGSASSIAETRSKSSLLPVMAIIIGLAQ